MLMDGANPQFRWNDNTPVLHLVAGRGNATVASALVEAGAQVDATDDLGATVLHLAASFGRLDLVEFLVAIGADVTVRDIGHLTPRDVVCWVVTCSPDVMSGLYSLLSA